MIERNLKMIGIGSAIVALLFVSTFVRAGEQTKAENLVPLELKLPPPAFRGTPRDIPSDSSVEPPSDKPRAPMMVPAGLVNLVAGKPPTSSDPNANASMFAKITDGKKNSSDDNIALLRKGTQYVQFDLGGAHEIFAIVIWHAFDSPKVYRDVVVQVADDAAFQKNVRTLFNNDRDNSSGLGAGADREYFESHEGKLVDAKGAKTGFVRAYSRGSTESALNEYTEVEIYGRPVP